MGSLIWTKMVMVFLLILMIVMTQIQTFILKRKKFQMTALIQIAMTTTIC